MMTATTLVVLVALNLFGVFEVTLAGGAMGAAGSILMALVHRIGPYTFSELDARKTVANLPILFELAAVGRAAARRGRLSERAARFGLLARRGRPGAVGRGARRRDARRAQPLEDGENEVGRGLRRQ